MEVAGAVVDLVLTMACPQGRYNLVMGAGLVVETAIVVVVVVEEEAIVAEAVQVAQLAMEEAEEVAVAAVVVAVDMTEAAGTARLCTCTRPLQQQEEVEAVALA